MKLINSIGKIVEINNMKVTINLFDEYINNDVTFFHGLPFRIKGQNVLLKVLFDNFFIIYKITSEKTFIETNNNLQFILNIYCNPIGRIIDNKFELGSFWKPKIFSDVFLLTDEDFILIKNINEKNDDYRRNIKSKIGIELIGNNTGKNYEINVNNFFSSHIGILGITGSGKSNTMAKIMEIYMSFCNNNNLSIKNILNKKLILIDTNGEYKDYLEKNKKVFSNLNFFSVSLGNEAYSRYFNIDLLNKENLKILLDANSEEEVQIIEEIYIKWERILSTEGQENSSLILKKYFYELTKCFWTYIKAILSSNYTNPLKISYIKRIAKKILTNIESFFPNEKNIFLINEFKKFSNLKLTSGSSGNSTYIKFENGNQFNVEIVESIIDQLKQQIEKYNFNEKVVLNKNAMFIIIADLIFESNDLFKVISTSNIFDRFSYVKNELKLFDNNQYVNSFSQKDIKNNNIFIFDVSEIDYFKGNIVGFLMNLFYEKELNNNNTTHFFVDEAHYYCNREQSVIKDEVSRRTLKLFQKIAKEGRKFGNFLILSSQRPSDISPLIFSQFGTYFIHRLISNDDIEVISKFSFSGIYNIFENTKSFSPGECVFNEIYFPFPTIIKVDEPDNPIKSKTKKLI